MTRRCNPRLAVRQHDDGLTQVELIWIEQRLEHWLRFGEPVAERILSRRTRVLSFRPDMMFALIRWASNEHGTVKSRIDIVRTVRPGEAYTTLPFVRPGGEILLSIQGWPRVEQVLCAIDGVEAVGVTASAAAPDHWRHIHSRIAAGMQPRPYTAARHHAFLLRASIER
jgi:hypothetical protein